MRARVRGPRGDLHGAVDVLERVVDGARDRDELQCDAQREPRQRGGEVRAAAPVHGGDGEGLRDGPAHLRRDGVREALHVHEVLHGVRRRLRIGREANRRRHDGRVPAGVRGRGGGHRERDAAQPVQRVLGVRAGGEGASRRRAVTRPPDRAVDERRGGACPQRGRQLDEGQLPRAVPGGLRAGDEAQVRLREDGQRDRPHVLRGLRVVRRLESDEHGIHQLRRHVGDRGDGALKSVRDGVRRRRAVEQRLDAVDDHGDGGRTVLPRVGFPREDALEPEQRFV
mmetsp:Transcript_53652/g.165002  ORF Transcript_53652/g.165002 Transcript_53652/m.165002 type:complete len:283 (+) Transcript_53652:383-1231(+)